MKAAAAFVDGLTGHNLLNSVQELRCDLYGSLAATGKGHGTDRAVMLGFMSELPDRVDVKTIAPRLQEIETKHELALAAGRTIRFDPREHLDFKRLQPLPLHPNGMHFTALNENGAPIFDQIYYSLGGGFIATETELKTTPIINDTNLKVPYPFGSGKDLLRQCAENGISIAELKRANEETRRSTAIINAQLDAIWAAMQECVKNGLEREGVLPGGLNVRRRAKAMHDKLLSQNKNSPEDPLSILDWVNLYALAVNEENAAGGRVVTAPTNGAAGIIPSVLHYATRFRHSPHEDGVHRFLLTAGAIASLYKTNASISGADVGCQGEVGVACSMAAGALVEYLGGTPQQVENAAEIGMEHNLGLTCDPIRGLVQVPCIERNAMGSVKAINAARLALSGDGAHFVSLDKVINTMWLTGKDMMDKYKETSRGGLAVNVVEC